VQADGGDCRKWLIHQREEQTMSSGRGINRRRFLGVAAGAAGAASVGSLSAGAATGKHAQQGKGHDGGHGIPRSRLGLQQWSIRDAIIRRDNSAQGYLGGRSFPEDPKDLGPLVTLPGGFASVFRYLASVGYRGFEFYSFDQGANGTIDDVGIKAGLDSAGLVAAGTHTGSLPQMVDPAYRQKQIDRAHFYGYGMIGTAGNPANPTLGTLDAWKQYAEQANTVGAALRDAGLKYFFHPEQDWFRFFDDPAHPELSRVHRIDWFTDHTDRRLVNFEPDTMHTLGGRARFPDPVDGSLFDVNGWYGRLAAQGRLIAWHIKDADRIPLPTPGTNPFSQEHVRPTFPLNGGVDVVYVGEGSIGKGYPADIDPAVLGFPETFRRYRLSAPGWFHTESDSGPGSPTSDPGRSLRWAKVSARYMLSLAGHRKGHHQRSHR
jgi:sugar phosphate isomerase/epimerase